jgi:hypothetical protein
MSIRLDPRRLGVLKRLAADAGVRPGDLVRVWVEERLDAERTGGAVPAGGGDDFRRQLEDLVARVSALEAAGRPKAGETARTPDAPKEPDIPKASDDGAAESDASPGAASTEGDSPAATPTAIEKPRRRTKVAARPKDPRIPLHEEIIAVIRERGPMTAGDLAVAIAERGRYSPPRSGKPLDAAMVSQRVSNPTYRSRFTRSEGRIGLAE